MNKAELLALAVLTMNNAFDPDSKAFKLRNPGLLRDEDGVRSFPTWAGGFRALVVDMERLNQALSIRKAFEKYGLLKIEHEFLVYDFLGRAFGRDITKDTVLAEI